MPKDQEVELDDVLTSIRRLITLCDHIQQSIAGYRMDFYSHLFILNSNSHTETKRCDFQSLQA